MEPILEIKGVSKSFIGVQALDDVSFQCFPGKVHVLQGENGAGKSTILKIISGFYRQDSGSIIYKGKEVKFRHPLEARKAGIAMVYQELTVLPHLTVAQNVFLNEEHLVTGKKKSAYLREKLLREKVVELAKTYDIEVDPYAMVGDLPLAKQQMVEILKVLVIDPDVIILDEPTSALASEEVAKLYQIVRTLQKKGKTVFFISHRLNEVFQFGESITVLKDGKHIVTTDIASVTRDDVIRLMVGRELSDIFPHKREIESDEIVFSARNISSGNRLHNVSFDVAKGEIIGIAGLQGQGQTDLLRALAGVTPTSGGTVSINGKQVNNKSPRKAIRAGIAYIPEDRKLQALFLGLSVRENLAIASLKARQFLGWVNRKKEEAMTSDNISLLNIRTPSSEQYVTNLSGGNQQKVVVGKGIAIKPKALLFNEPTRGIDVDAKREIYILMRKFADEGVAVIMYSSDLMEVVGLSDKVLTMFEGVVTVEIARDEISEAAIMKGAVGR